MADMNRPGLGTDGDAGRDGVSLGSDDASQKSTARASTQDIRADAVAAIELFRELFPRGFPLYGARLPLKIGIEAEIIPVVRGAMKSREVIDAVRFYTGSAAYLRCLRPGAIRIDLAATSGWHRHRGRSSAGNRDAGNAPDEISEPQRCAHESATTCVKDHLAWRFST